MDPNLRRSIILEHYQNPKNRGLTDEEGYMRVNTNNDSCIDEIDLMIKIEDGIIKEIYPYNEKEVTKDYGEACAICTSSTSIMIDTLIGKTIDEVIDIYQNFSNMIDEKEYNEEILEQAVVYDDIYKQPNRKKCALLPWWGIEKIINKIKGE